MANKAEGKGQEGTGSEYPSSDLNIVESVKAIAAYNARADLDTEHQMTLFLKSWWSNTYNRPLKDPLLESYTLEELLYEFYDKIERQKAGDERSTQETDKIEEVKEKEVLDWVEEEEKKELEEEMKRATVKSVNPTQDPENIKWMNEQLEKAKQVHGETFGEDIDEKFEG
jgi:hypothetical protein